jgi:hypothetical protein
VTAADAGARRPTTTVGRFALRTLGWLPVAFAVWYVAAPAILYPVALIVRGVAYAAMRGLVAEVEQSRAVVTFVTTLKLATFTPRAVLTVDVNMLLYAFGLPLFAALTLAAHERNWKRHLAVGYAVLLPLIAGCVLADFLKNVTITAGPTIAAQTGFVAWQREAIAFAFQFGSLILPAVAPAVLWVALHGRFVAALRPRAG